MRRLRLLLLWTLLVACPFFIAAAVSAPADPAPPSGLPRAEPGEVGMVAPPLAEIAPAMQQFVDHGEVAGVVTLVARRGRCVHLEAVGYADVESKKPMRPDTIFAIASMTKPITATAVMILQDEGKLGVDDPVAKYLPEFSQTALESGPPNRPITLRDLMTHTSGLGGSQQNQGSLAETVRQLAARPLQFQPGTKWQYSPGLSVCGRVVEVVSGRPFDRFLEERIFRPLKMADTTFYPTPQQQERLASLYQPGPAKGTLEKTTHWISELTPDRSPNPSGGLFSTAPDMVRFYQMILNGGQLDGERIVSESAVRAMSTIHTGDLTAGFTPSCGWGLGWGIVDKPEDVTSMLSPGTFGHGGAFGTQGWIDPKREMIFVLMIQRTGFGNGDRSPIRAKFQQLAVDAVHEATQTTSPPFYQDKMNLLVWLDAEGRAHPINEPQGWQRRREHILANMQLVMGPLPSRDTAVPLDVQVLESEQLAKVTRKKISYTASPGDQVPAYLLIPREIKGRVPGILCLHGTDGPRGRTAGLGPDYPRYALELAERGYVTIAPDYPLLGDNQTDPASLGYVSGTMKGIWDHMRAIDLLESLPEVDGGRIGVCGLSLGGHNSLFVGAMDPRIKVVVSSSGFDSFSDYMGGNLAGWCQTRYMPRIETVYGKDPKRLPFDFPEVLAAIAPRHLYIHAPLGDTNFRVESAKRCVEAARTVYRLLGAEERLVIVCPPGGHGFPPEAREEAYAFIAKALNVEGPNKKGSE